MLLSPACVSCDKALVTTEEAEWGLQGISRAALSMEGDLQVVEVLAAEHLGLPWCMASTRCEYVVGVSRSVSCSVSRLSNGLMH